MKIIFSNKFITDLKQLGLVLKFVNFSIVQDNGSLNKDSILRLPDIESLRELRSIWDSNKNLLSMSLVINNDSDQKLFQKNESNCCIQIMYSRDYSREQEVAFVLVGEDTSIDESGEIKLSNLNFSIIKNLVNIDFSNISVAARIDTNLTENTEMLENPIGYGYNIYLIKPDDEKEAISKESFIKKLYRKCCSNIDKSFLEQDYLDSSSGERIYRNLIHRVYNPEQFYPKLIGDAIVLEDESLGLDYRGGKVSVVGVVGYTDYEIKNSQIFKINTGFENINEIPKLQLTILNSNITILEITDKTITFDKLISPGEKYAKLRVELPTLNINTLSGKFSINNIQKDFELKQSTEYNNPWELILPDNIDLKYEYNLSGGIGISSVPIPVIILPKDDLTIEKDNSFDLVLQGVDKSISEQLLNNYTISFEFAEGYSNSEFIDPSNGQSKIESAEDIFNAFFKIDNPVRGELTNSVKFKISRNYEGYKLTDYHPKNLWSPFSNYKNDYGNKQLLVKCNISIKEFESYITSFYLVQEPIHDSVLKLIDEDGNSVNTIRLNQINKEFSKTVRLVNEVTTDEIIDTTNNSWIIANPNISSNLNSYINDTEVNFGKLTIDTTTWKKEYSDNINFVSLSNKFDLKNIVFIYLSNKIIDSDFQEKFDYFDWKSTILMPKLEIPVEKEQNLSIVFESIEEIVEEDGTKKYSKIQKTIDCIDDIHEGELWIGSIGKTQIKVISNCDVRADFTSTGLLDLDIKNTLIKAGSSGNINIVLKSYERFYEENNEAGQLNIYTDTNKNISIKLKILTHLNNTEYLNNFPDEINIEKIDPKIDNIFLSGYELKNSDIIGNEGGELVNIKYFSPLLPIVTGTTINDSDLNFIKSGIVDETSGLVYEYYNPENGEISNINNDGTLETIIGTNSNYGEFNKSTDIEINNSRISSEKNLYKKYPVDKLGEIHIHLDSCKYKEQIFNVFKKGLHPRLFNSYNDSLLNNINVNIVRDLEDQPNTIKAYVGLKSLYPITEGKTVNYKFENNPELINTSNFSIEFIESEGESFGDRYYEKMLGNYTLKIVISGLDTSIELGEYDRLFLGTTTINHMLPKEMVFSDYVYGENIDNDIISDLVGVHKTKVDFYWVGTSVCDLVGDISDISPYGETRYFSLNKPHSFTSNLVNIGDDNEETNVINYTNFPSTDKTSNNSTVNFEINFPKYNDITDLFKDKLDLTSKNDLDLIKQLIQERYFEFAIEIFNGSVKLEDISKIIRIKQCTNNCIFLKDSSDYYAYVKEDDIIETKGISVLSNTQTIDLTILPINLKSLIDFNRKNYDLISNGELFSVEIIDDNISNSSGITITVDNTEVVSDSTNNVHINLPINTGDIDRIIKLKITSGNISFIYSITQRYYNPKVYINDKYLLNFDKLFLGFHSSGSYLNNNYTSFGEITVRSNTLDIYDLDEKNRKLRIKSNNGEDIGLMTYVTKISTNNDGEYVGNVLISISPNYLREIRSGELVLSCGTYGKSWKIGYMQGYLSSIITMNDDENNLYLLQPSDNPKYLVTGLVGTEKHPILFPPEKVKYSPYFNIKIVQREVYYNENERYKVSAGEEIIISNSYNNITPSSTKSGRYAIVTYRSESWTANINGGVEALFKPGSYDTDLYYKKDEGNFPQLIHKYEVADGYVGSEAIINIITKLSISSYKKYLYEDSSNVSDLILNSDVLSLDTTPLIYSFWINKTKAESSIPIKICYPGENTSIDNLIFTGNKAENKNIIVLLENNNEVKLSNIDVNISDDWAFIKKDYYNKTISVITDINKTGKARGCKLIVTPANTNSLIKGRSINLIQEIPEISLDLPELDLFNKLIQISKDKDEYFIKLYSSSKVKTITGNVINSSDETGWIEGVEFLTDRENFGWKLKLNSSDFNTERLALLNLKVTYIDFEDVEKTWENQITLIQQ